MSKPAIVALSPGDPAGIGPEIAWKVIRSGEFQKKGIELLCVGATKPFHDLGEPVIETNSANLLAGEKAGARVKHPFAWILPAPEKSRHLLEGFQAGWSIETATRLVQRGVARALVTGPIHKERLRRGGFPYPGHTEFLAKLCGVKEVTMMLANDQLRVSLVTTHLALKDVPRALTRAKIRRAVLQTTDALSNRWGIRKPRIAVMALNPHAGESGLFGNEEIQIITPVIRALQKAARGRFLLTGPHPSDTFFATQKCDAVICMYHDQGLIPVKLIDFKNTVNVTLGLPIVRTSVDHGVGFDIAGKGVADPSSLRAAINLAVKLSR